MRKEQTKKKRKKKMERRKSPVKQILLELQIRVNNPPPESSKTHVAHTQKRSRVTRAGRGTQQHSFHERGLRHKRVSMAVDDVVDGMQASSLAGVSGVNHGLRGARHKRGFGVDGVGERDELLGDVGEVLQAGQARELCEAGGGAAERGELGVEVLRAAWERDGGAGVHQRAEALRVRDFAEGVDGAAERGRGEGVEALAGAQRAAGSEQGVKRGGAGDEGVEAGGEGVELRAGGALEEVELV